MIGFLILMILLIVGIVLSFFSKRSKGAKIASMVIITPCAILLIILGLTMIGLIPPLPFTTPLLPQYPDPGFPLGPTANLFVELPP